jgi:hypothetical protein
MTAPQQWKARAAPAIMDGPVVALPAAVKRLPPRFAAELRGLPGYTGKGAMREEGPRTTGASRSRATRLFYWQQPWIGGWSYVSNMHITQSEKESCAGWSRGQARAADALKYIRSTYYKAAYATAINMVAVSMLYLG